MTFSVFERFMFVFYNSIKFSRISIWADCLMKNKSHPKVALNGVVSIKSCSHAETYRIAKTSVLTLQR